MAKFWNSLAATGRGRIQPWKCGQCSLTTTERAGAHNPAAESVGYPRPLSQTVPRLRFVFSDWVSCSLG